MLVFLSGILGERTLVSVPGHYAAALGELGFGLGRSGFESFQAVSWGQSFAISETWLPYLEDGD